MPVVDTGTDVIEFPDGMSDADIKSALDQRYEQKSPDISSRVPPASLLTKFVPDTSSNLPRRELPDYLDQPKDTTDYAGESLLGISPEDIPSGVGTTAPALTIPLSAMAKTEACALQYATSPRGLGMVAGAASPVAPAVYAKWAYDMLKGGIDSAKDAGEAVASLIRDHINRQMAPQLGEEKPPVDEEQVQLLTEDAVTTAAS